MTDDGQGDSAALLLPRRCRQRLVAASSGRRLLVAVLLFSAMGRWCVSPRWLEKQGWVMVAGDVATVVVCD
ncbi:hypothetical protein Dimus_026572, partial [Dionaea muscipula]